MSISPQHFLQPDIIFDAAGLLLNESTLFSAALYAILLGLAGGLAAVAFGVIDYVKLSNRPRSFRLASWHGGIQFVVLVIFGVIAGLKLQAYPDMSSPSAVELGIMGSAVIVMLIGNYLGGELVITHRIGIDEE